MANFTQIYNIENGVLIEHSPPPQANYSNYCSCSFMTKMANGSYVVNGLEVMFLQKEEGEGGKKYL